jgi:hypothetical protein
MTYQDCSVHQLLSKLFFKEPSIFFHYKKTLVRRQPVYAPQHRRAAELIPSPPEADGIS